MDLITNMLNTLKLNEFSSASDYLGDLFIDSFLADFFTKHCLQFAQDNPLKDYIIEQ